MKPGDMIEWAYKSSGNVVTPDEELWSTPMQQWVPIGCEALLISITKDMYMWLSDKRLFHARVDDTVRDDRRAGDERVVPRTKTVQ